MPKGWDRVSGSRIFPSQDSKRTELEEERREVEVLQERMATHEEGEVTEGGYEASEEASEVEAKLGSSVSLVTLTALTCLGLPGFCYQGSTTEVPLLRLRRVPDVQNDLFSKIPWTLTCLAICFSIVVFCSSTHDLY